MVRQLLLIAPFVTLILSGCTGPTDSSEPPTPSPEIFIPLTAVAPNNAPVISGQVLWGTGPVAGAQVELRKGAWADPENSETIAVAIADDDGHYELEAPPSGGEFGLVAGWPDGGANTAAVTPVQVVIGENQTGVNVYLAKELEILEPAPGTDVNYQPALRWTHLPDVARYKLLVIDAGTTEMIFDLDIADTSYAVQEVKPTPLTAGHQYTWVVNGLAADDSLLASLTGSFRVGRCYLFAGYETFVDSANGYCFAYPAEAFELKMSEIGQPIVYGPALDESLDPLRATLVVEVEVAVQDKDLTEIVDGYLAQFDGMDIPPITRTPFSLGDQPAELLDGVPGRGGSRDLFLLRNGTLFHLIFMPSVRDFPQAASDVEFLFETVTASFDLVSVPGSASR